MKAALSTACTAVKAGNNRIGFRTEKGWRRMLSKELCIAASLIVILPTYRPARAQERVLVAYAGINETAAPMWVAIEKGLFRKNGLDVSMLQLRSGPLMMATLASGSVQLVWPSPSSVLSAASGGLKIGCVASPVNRIGRHLIVRKEIKSLEELRAKSLECKVLGEGFGYKLCWFWTIWLWTRIGTN